MPYQGDTTICNDVRLGFRSTIMPGVTVGDGAVAADVPPYAIVAGNPARVVRRRFSENNAARLQRIAW